MDNPYIGKLVAHKSGKQWILGMIVEETIRGSFRVEWYSDTKLLKLYAKDNIDSMLETYKHKVYDRIKLNVFYENQ